MEKKSSAIEYKNNKVAVRSNIMSEDTIKELFDVVNFLYAHDFSELTIRDCLRNHLRYNDFCVEWFKEGNIQTFVIF